MDTVEGSGVQPGSLLSRSFRINAPTHGAQSQPLSVPKQIKHTLKALKMTNEKTLRCEPFGPNPRSKALAVGGTVNPKQFKELLHMMPATTSAPPPKATAAGATATAAAPSTTATDEPTTNRCATVGEIFEAAELLRTNSTVSNQVAAEMEITRKQMPAAKLAAAAFRPEQGEVSEVFDARHKLARTPVIKANTHMNGTTTTSTEEAKADAGVGEAETKSEAGATATAHAGASLTTTAAATVATAAAAAAASTPATASPPAQATAPPLSSATEVAEVFGGRYKLARTPPLAGTYTSAASVPAAEGALAAPSASPGFASAITTATAPALAADAADQEAKSPADGSDEAAHAPSLLTSSGVFMPTRMLPRTPAAAAAAARAAEHAQEATLKAQEGAVPVEIAKANATDSRLEEDADDSARPSSDVLATEATMAMATENLAMDSPKPSSAEDAGSPPTVEQHRSGYRTGADADAGASIVSASSTAVSAGASTDIVSTDYSRLLERLRSAEVQAEASKRRLLQVQTECDTKVRDLEDTNARLQAQIHRTLATSPRGSRSTPAQPPTPSAAAGELDTEVEGGEDSDTETTVQGERIECLVEQRNNLVLDQLDQRCGQISALQARDVQFEADRQARIKALEEGAALHQAIQEHEQASAAALAAATAAAADAHEKQVAKAVAFAAESEAKLASLREEEARLTAELESAQKTVKGLRKKEQQLVKNAKPQLATGAAVATSAAVAAAETAVPTAPEQAASGASAEIEVEVETAPTKEPKGNGRNKRKDSAGENFEQSTSKGASSTAASSEDKPKRRRKRGSEAKGEAGDESEAAEGEAAGMTAAKGKGTTKAKKANSKAAKPKKGKGRGKRQTTKEPALTKVVDAVTKGAAKSGKEYATEAEAEAEASMPVPVPSPATSGVVATPAVAPKAGARASKRASAKRAADKISEQATNDAAAIKADKSPRRSTRKSASTHGAAKNEDGPTPVDNNTGVETHIETEEQPGEEIEEAKPEEQRGQELRRPSTRVKGKSKRPALGVVPANGADRLPSSKPEPAKRRKLLRGGQMLQPDASFDSCSAETAASASASGFKAAAKTAAAAKQQQQQRNLSLFTSFVDKTNFKVPKIKGTAASARLMQQQRDARRGKK